MPILIPNKVEIIRVRFTANSLIKDHGLPASMPLLFQCQPTYVSVTNQMQVSITKNLARAAID